jgi:chromosome segregation ATPase
MYADPTAGIKPELLIQRLNKLGFNHYLESGNFLLLETLVSHLETTAYLLQKAHQSLDGALRELQQNNERLDTETRTRKSLHELIGRLTMLLPLEQQPDITKILAELTIADSQESMQARSAVANFEAAFTAMANRLALLESQAKVADSSLALKNRELADERKLRSDLQTERDQLTVKVSKLELVEKELRSDLKKTEEDLNRLKEDANKFKEETLAASERAGKKQKELEVALSKIEEIQKDVEKLNKELEISVKSKEELSSTLEKTKKEKLDCENQIDDLKGDLAKSETLLKIEKAKVEDLELQITEANIRSKLGFLTEDRVREAESESRDTYVKLLLAEKELDTLNTKYSRNLQDFNIKDSQDGEVIRNLVVELDRHKLALANVQTRNQCMRELFSKLKSCLKLAKTESNKIELASTEGLERLTDTICVTLHDLENKVFLLSLDNKKLEEETQETIESNDKLWSEMECLLEECARLRAAQQEPLILRTVAESLDEYVQSAYPKPDGLLAKECSHLKDLQAYRQLILDLEESSSKKSPKFEQGTLRKAHIPSKPLNKNQTFKQPDAVFLSNVNPTIQTGPPRDELKGEKAPEQGNKPRKEKSALLSLEKDQRVAQQRAIKARVDAVARELGNLKAICTTSNFPG